MKRGFTLVELLVAISIFGLITAAVVVNFRGASPNRQLQLQAANIASLMRQAQVQAQAGEPYGGTVPAGGYGIHLNACGAGSCTITLFADQNNSFSMQSPAEVVQTIDLGQTVYVSGVSSGGQAHVIFRPPAGSICLENVCSGAAPLTITLAAAGTSMTRVLTVNQLSGQITY